MSPTNDNPGVEIEAEATAQPVVDHLPRMRVSLPVKLIAVEDVTLPAHAGREGEMDRLYVGLLDFERLPGKALAYRAENLALRFELWEGLIERDGYRPLQVVVKSLDDTERRFVEAEVPHTRQRGVNLGQESLTLYDPAGNWVEIVESRQV